ncbi:MAG: hypothetical protein ACK5KM_15955, partial [Hyphomicrobiaceae bacterium]
MVFSTATTRQMRSSDAVMSGVAASGAVAAGTAIGVPRSQPIPVQPRIEYVETPDRLADTTRFERALSGVGALADDAQGVDAQVHSPQAEEHAASRPVQDYETYDERPAGQKPTHVPETEHEYVIPHQHDEVAPEGLSEPVSEPEAVAEPEQVSQPEPESRPGPARRKTDDAVAAAAAAAAAAVAFTARTVRSTAPASHPPETESRETPEHVAPVTPDVVPPPADQPSQSPVAASGGMAGVSTEVRAPALMPTDRQDLKLVRGIDAGAERVLNGLGVWRFSEIARWLRGDVDAVNSALGETSRVERENWIEQATLLADGTLTDHARRVLRGEKVGATPTAVAQPSRGPAPMATAPALSPPPAPPAGSSSTPSMMANAAAIAIAAASASASRGQAASDMRVVRAPRPKIAPIVEQPKPPPTAESAVQSSQAESVETPAEPVTPVSPPASAAEPSVQETMETAPAQTDQVDVQADEVQAETTVGSDRGDVDVVADQQEPEPATEAPLSKPEAVTPEEVAPPATRPARLADAMRENRGPETDQVPEETEATEDTPQAEEHAPAPDAASGETGRPRKDVAGLRSVRSAALRPSPSLGGQSDMVDDLKRIRGVGVLIEKKLNSLGITAYEQIANWTADDIAHVSEVLDFRGRIERENWVEQARILSAGGQTEFSRRVDRGELS